MKIDTNVVFEYMEESWKNRDKIVVHQGGSRSGKTHNILLWLIVKAMTEFDNYTIDITRISMPALRFSAMSQFFEILQKYNLYKQEDHNRTWNTYTIRNNLFRFFSADDFEKVRGATRNILFINESNQFKNSTYRQLNQRTQNMTIMDYNPSDEQHWIYDEVIPRSDTAFYRTTYRDNPYTSEKERREIEHYKEIDENYWRIFGLGEIGFSGATIYTNWDYIDNMPTQHAGEEFYGLDFGYNHPSALVRTIYDDDIIYTEEILYRNHMTTDELIEAMKERGVPRDKPIIADSSRPEMIQQLYNSGFNIYPCTKKQDSVFTGINWLKSRKIYITKNSTNTITEIKNYKWRVDKNEKIMEEPVKENDHSCDAIRYSLDFKIFQDTPFTYNFV